MHQWSYDIILPNLNKYHLLTNIVEGVFTEGRRLYSLLATLLVPKCDCGVSGNIITSLPYSYMAMILMCFPFHLCLVLASYWLARSSSVSGVS
jgi:hypothetical protein